MSDLIAVWFSCGAASAVAAKLTLDRFGRDRVRVVNSPVIEEDEDNRRFLVDVEKWLGEQRWQTTCRGDVTYFVMKELERRG